MVKKFLSAVSVCATLCGIASAMPVRDGETDIASLHDPSKDYAYFCSLSDYEVYVEYCQTVTASMRCNPEFALGPEWEIPIEDEIPERIEQDLHLIDYTECSTDFVVYCYGLDVEEEDMRDYEKQPALFGFPENWYQPSTQEGYGDSRTLRCHLFQTVDDQTVFFLRAGSRLRPDDVYINPLEDEVDIIRLQLTIYNSEFGAKYLDDSKTSFPFSVDIPQLNILAAEPVFGDVNGDGTVNANDAACILRYSAAYGAKNFTGTFEEYMQQ